MGQGPRLAVLALAAGLIAGCGGSSTHASTSAHGHQGRSARHHGKHGGKQATAAVEFHSRYPFGPFSGYLWFGPVQTISGDWRVPSVLHNSGYGRAGTWIGAQGDTENAPFIQVGTNEERLLLEDRYYTFWSDVVNHFHPRRLFSVRPGDAIHATMTLSGGAWHISIRDETSGAEKTFATQDEATGYFNVGEWYQEDITDAFENKPFPYPSLAPIRWTGVTVDGHAPQAGQLDHHWLRAPNGSVVAPGPLRDERFTIAPLTHFPSPDALFYLSIASAVDGPAKRFQTTFVTWTPETPTADITSAAKAYAVALQANAEGFAGRIWQTPLRPRIDDLSSAVKALHGLLVAGPSSGAVGNWLDEVGAAMQTLGARAQALRDALHLPLIGVADTAS